jgi:hypothetical protein
MKTNQTETTTDIAALPANQEQTELQNQTVPTAPTEPEQPDTTERSEAATPTVPTEPTEPSVPTEPSAATTAPSAATAPSTATEQPTEPERIIFTQSEVAKLVDEAYLRGKNEAIKAKILEETATRIDTAAETTPGLESIFTFREKVW